MVMGSVAAVVVVRRLVFVIVVPRLLLREQSKASKASQAIIAKQK